jgi:hypothetical protein
VISHPLLDKLKQDPNLFSLDRVAEGIGVIDYYSKMYSATDALDSIIKILNKLAQAKHNYNMLSTRKTQEIEFDLAFFNVLKIIFYAMEKQYNSLDSFPDFSGDLKSNINILNDWSDNNLQKILKFVAK